MPTPDFVLRLRERIGTELLWLPGTSAVVLGEDGRVLLGRRADNGRWAVPSGILEPGEHPAAAIVREVQEETGIDVEVLALTALTTTGVVEYPNGDRAQYLDSCFWCRPLGGDLAIGDDESTELGWFAPDALPEPMNPSSLDRIAHTLAYMDALHRGEPAAPHFPR